LVHHYILTINPPEKHAELNARLIGAPTVTRTEAVARQSRIPIPAGLTPPAWWPAGDIAAANLAAAREAMR